MTENFELYRKYRPQTFDDVVGNENTIKALKAELQNGSHVFLMSGNAGCGKTTLARIVAREVGAGELSIHEINSSENRGIDTAREVMEQMRYNPPDGKAVVWIFDECHQWLAPVQNAFLKAFEDTPSHVYFFLCTTDPQKLIAPLKSRCSMVQVKPLSDSEMEFLLKRTARAEKRKISSEIIEKIVEIAGGGSRRALKLLAKVLYLDDEAEKLDILKNESIGDDNPESIELCRALINRQPLTAILALLKKLDLSEPEKIRQGVMGYMHAVLTGGKANPAAMAAIQAFSNADTYRNGKFAITIAILDYNDMLN